MSARWRWPIGLLMTILVAGNAAGQYSQTPPAPPQDVPATRSKSTTPAPRPPRKPPVKPEPAPAPPVAAVAPAPPKPGAHDPECSYTGKRVVNSLARDDVDAAQKFMRFYDLFACPAEHVREAFRCTVKAGPPPAPGKALSDRVDGCWDKLAATPAAQPPQSTTGAASPAAAPPSASPAKPQTASPAAPQGTPPTATQNR